MTIDFHYHLEQQIPKMEKNKKFLRFNNIPVYVYGYATLPYSIPLAVLLVM